MVFQLALGALGGIVWVQSRADLPSFAWLVSGALLAIAATVLFDHVCEKKLWHTKSQPIKFRHTKGAKFVVALLLTLSAGFCAALLATAMAHRALSDQLSDALDQQSVLLDVVVKDLPTRDERSWRFEVQVLHAALTAQPDHSIASFPPRGVIHWYESRNVTLPEALHPGERWRFQAKVRRPAGPLNPGGFDVEAWAIEKGLGFSANVQQGRHHQVPHRIGQEGGLAITVDQWRDQIRSLIDRNLGDSPATAVIVALVIGDQRAVAVSDWAVFQRTGVSHLMSISGLHVTMVAALFGWLAGLLWRALCRWPLSVGLWIPVQSVVAVAALLGAFGYAMLAGFAVPAQRTAWMVLVTSIARILGVQANPWAVLAIALLVVIIPDPMAVLAPGFWLSFLAVAFLFTLSGAEHHPPQRSWWQRQWEMLRTAGHAQLAITFGLLPITVMFFQQIVLVGPLANAVAIPVVSYAVTPLAMVGVLETAWLSSSVLLQWAAAVQQWLQSFLVWCAALPMAAVDWPSPGVWRTALASAALVIAIGKVLPVRWARWRHFGWLGLLLLWGVTPAPPGNGEMEVQFMDIGQGSSVLVRTQSHVLLYDTGPKSGGTDAGARIIVPQLRRLGIDAIDQLVVSHFDQDHSGGMASILAMGDVKALMVSEPQELSKMLPTELAVPPVRGCEAGQRWQWDGVMFEVLHPLSEQTRQLEAALKTSAKQLFEKSADEKPKRRWRIKTANETEQRPRKRRFTSGTDSEHYKSENKKADHQKSVRSPRPRDTLANTTGTRRNRGSCVIRIRSQSGHSILLAGDIPVSSELEIIARTSQRRGLQSEVLVAPHHGSKTSTSPEFLEAVNPAFYVIQAGYRNRYGHPHQEVLRRVTGFHGASVKVLRTDWQGSIRLRWEEGVAVINDFWSTHRRWWHRPRGPGFTDQTEEQPATESVADSNS